MRIGTLINRLIVETKEISQHRCCMKISLEGYIKKKRVSNRFVVDVIDEDIENHSKV